MARVYIERDGQWVEDKSLRACGPYIFEASESGRLFPDLEGPREEPGTDEISITPVPRGLGMGWPDLKDLGVAADFAETSETITLDEGTNQ